MYVLCSLALVLQKHLFLYNIHMNYFASLQKQHRKKTGKQNVSLNMIYVIYLFCLCMCHVWKKKSQIP